MDDLCFRWYIRFLSLQFDTFHSDIGINLEASATVFATRDDLQTGHIASLVFETFKKIRSTFKGKN